MIGMDHQFQNFPPLLGTFLLDEGLAVFNDSASQHGFAALGAPDQMVDDKVDTVFISLVVHVDDHIRYNMEINVRYSMERRLKPGKAPHRYHSNDAACGGLKPNSVREDEEIPEGSVGGKAT